VMINVCGGRSWERLMEFLTLVYLLYIIITRGLFDKSYNTYYKYHIIYHFTVVKSQTY